MALLTRRNTLAAFAGVLAGCGGGERRDAPPTGSLAWAIAGPWRLEPERDRWRHPLQTLQFWGLQGDMTVLELLPGRGWYTAILAPYLAANGGRLIAASFDPRTRSVSQREVLADWELRFMHNQELFGAPERVSINAPALAAPGSVDLAILANNVHTLMAEGAAEHVFRAVLAALKPGGVFGVEQHRAASTGLQDPLAGTGYVQEAYVKTLAQEAGFDFVAASDVNANPRDRRDHPFGVWTLPPTLRTSPLGQPDDPTFDSAPFESIGESDRMTLRFRKPAGARAPIAPSESQR
ncbi:MAG: class I SAM-dependent methyltransferase [Hyphomonadaceae bacterium]|nr:class I SAM-dependent methyltransferase [Hyphomonadaceae bacterium]MBX3510641.1 class I SAM-dependent methyltransferase [Hyphomonadaceae bacterium]